MASQLDVYNLALSNLNSSQTVQSINDASNAAGACNRFYNLARQRVLERAPWDFAGKAVALPLVVDQSTLPNQAAVYFPGWRYIYQRPLDCFRFLWVTTQFGLRTNPFLAFWWRAGAMDCSAGSWGPFRPPYRQVIDTVNQVSPGNQIDLLTDQDSAWGIYVTDVQNVGLWTAQFFEAVAWNLAKYIAGPVSANEKAKAMAVAMADKSIDAAFALDANQKQPDPYPDSPAITARN